jgi:hypothetical protein
MANSQQPAYRAFTVVKREGADDFWLPIGAAFPHQDGEGFNLVLQALPIDGRVVLRTPKDDSADSERNETQPRQRSANNKSGRDRR